MMLFLPWSKIGGGDGALRLHIRRTILEGDWAMVSFDQNEWFFGSSSTHLPFCEHGYPTMQKAMDACDKELIALGHELLTEERAEKLRLLL